MTKTTRIPDDAGNCIIAEDSGNIINVYLQLNSENKKRLLGRILKDKRKLYIKRNREAHLFRKNNSYGFNYTLLKDGKLFDTVVLSDDIDIWEIPVSYILDNGSFLNFKSVGFERQIFLTLNQLKTYEVISGV
jgi:hypothetical protein